MGYPYSFGVVASSDPSALPPALTEPQGQTRSMRQNEMLYPPTHTHAHEQREFTGEPSQNFRESQPPDSSSSAIMSIDDYSPVPDPEYASDYPKRIEEISERNRAIMEYAFDGDESGMGPSTGPAFRESPWSSRYGTPESPPSSLYSSPETSHITPQEHSSMAIDSSSNLNSLPSSDTIATNSTQEQTAATTSDGRTRRASSQWTTEEVNVLMGLVAQNTSAANLTRWEPVYRGFRARFPDHTRKDRGLQMKVWRTWKENGIARRPNYHRA